MSCAWLPKPTLSQWLKKCEIFIRNKESLWVCDFTTLATEPPRGDDEISGPQWQQENKICLYKYVFSYHAPLNVHGGIDSQQLLFLFCFFYENCFSFVMHTSPSSWGKDNSRRRRPDLVVAGRRRHQPSYRHNRRWQLECRICISEERE